MQYRITAPVIDFTGMSAGVNFTTGTAELDAPDDPQHPHARALAYFRAQGYGVDEVEPEKPTSSRKTTPKGADQ